MQPTSCGDPVFQLQTSSSLQRREIPQKKTQQQHGTHAVRLVNSKQLQLHFYLCNFISADAEA